MSENTEPTKESIQESLPETEPQEVVSEEEVITAGDENTEQQTAQTVSENEPAEESSSVEEQLEDLENIEFPEASFDMLLMQHHTQAMLALGLIPDPATGKVIKNKSAAKFHIDMLSIIQERTKGNLSEGEAEALNGVLHNLRMMFVNNP
ncbi:MAG: hypothetical protein CMM06_05445 [Rhodopirellula sp.]|nr:hypothetical protein [Rhodopirellula sp.]HCA50872.1 hypothetical protein [Planctomycetaceae bacterium]|tara:strand:- start:6381 stop:6830 length:450 start_codon:yes stop_codon:yes gene_type:complete